MLRPILLVATLLSLLSSLSLALIDGTCPPSIQAYNASGLLGFFDPLLSEPIPEDDDSFNPTIDNDGYLYQTDDQSPSPPASFAYAMTVSFTTTTSDNETIPAILSNLIVSVHNNRTANSTADTSSSDESAVACALPIFNLPIRTTRLGQSDDGTCTSTLPRGCAAKIIKYVSERQFTWFPSQSLEDNLQSVCEIFASSLEAALVPTNRDIPEECTALFKEEVDDEEDNGEDDPGTVGRYVSQVRGFSLTSASTSTPINEEIPYRCDNLDVVDGTLGQPYVSYPFWNETAVEMDPTRESITQIWHEAVRRVYPVITMIFRAPPEDLGLRPEVELLSAHLGCVRMTEFTEGSVKAPELDPLTLGNGGLSTGAIAGIVVGVVLGLAVFVALVWLLRRTGRGKRGMLKGVGGVGHPRKSGEKYEMMDR